MKRLKIYILLCMILVGTLRYSTTFADDGADYTGDPQFKIHSMHHKLVPEFIKFDLHGNILIVTYVIKNISKYKDAVEIFFDVPEYAYGGDAKWYPDRSYSDLELFINEKRIEYTRKSIAYYKNKDITQMLQKYDIEPNYIGDLKKIDKMRGMSEEELRKYEELFKMDLELRFPAWIAKNIYSYKFSLKSNETVTIKYSYRILPGEFYTNKMDYCGNDTEGVKMLGEYNVTWEKMCAMFERKFTNNDYYSMQWMNLPLSGKNWNGYRIKKLLFNIVAQKMSLANKNEKQVFFLKIGNRVISGMDAIHAELMDFECTGPFPLLAVNFNFTAD